MTSKQAAADCKRLPFHDIFIALGAIATVFLAEQTARAQQSPEKELASLHPHADFDVTLFASEPMITNPSAIDVDTRGRVWVVEIQHYRAAAKGPPQEKIKVLEDTDGDGRADKVTVFYEGLFCPMSICVAGEKIYVATSPDLWVFEDKDGDLNADGPPKRLLTGFGGYNHDHGAHSLVLGPDHKWWMSHGDGGFDLKGTDGSHAVSKWGAILRGELDGSKLETPAVNFRNPYEVCVSSFGEPFCSDNDNDGLQSTRICWIMEGGNYGWYGGPPDRAVAGTPFGEMWHFRGHVPGNVPGTLLTGFGAPCGICFYEGDAFGPAFKNVPLHTDAGPAEVRAYPHQLSGAGMTASKQVLLTSRDRYFRPDDICAAPDGSLFVSDWYDGGVGGHAYNNPDQGRIFLLRPKGKQLARHEKPGPYDNIDDAIEGLKSPNLATQYLARERLLNNGEQSIPALKSLLSASDSNFAARALWVLDRIGGAGRAPVVDQLHSENSAMRALGIRILRRHGDEYATEMLKLADDPAMEVVREVLLAIRNLRDEHAQAALAAIARRYDGSDRYLLEAINVAVSDRQPKLYAQLAASGGFKPEQISLLQLLNPAVAGEQLREQLSSKEIEPEAVRKLLLWAGTASSPEIGKTLLAFLQQPNVPASQRQLALDVVAANLKGNWRSLQQGEQLTATLNSLFDDRELQPVVLRMVANQRLQQFADKVLTIAKSSASDEPLRIAAIKAVPQLNAAGAVEAMKALRDDDQPAIREAALLALVELQDLPSIRSVLASQDPKYGTRFRNEIANRLLATTSGAIVLRQLIEEHKLSEPLQQAVIDKAVRHPDANVRAIYEQYLPAGKRPKRLGEAVSATEILAITGDAERGAAIFSQSSAAQCNKCHAVHGSGESLGPDLSLIGKKYERAALLETILEPSKAIAPEYVSYVAVTNDGRGFVGFLVEKSDQEVVLKDAQKQIIRIPADNVESLTAQSKSIMPDLVLRDVTAQDAADLLAYLVSLK